MDADERVKTIQNLLGEQVIDLERPLGKRAYVRIAPENVTAAVKILFDECGGRLATVTGLDTRDGIEILYHFAFDADGVVVTLKAMAPKPLPEIDSVTAITPAAENIEREIHDLLGVKFRNHPRLERFILADDWPEGVYPMRREYKGPELQEL